MMTGIKEKASTAHIAIVEDDALVRESLSDCLESAGYSVQTFGSAEEFFGVEFGAKRGCLVVDTACLILDIKLPGASRLDLQRRLSNPGVPQLCL